MSRRKTRTLTGFATTTFVGFGLAIAAPAAMADTLDQQLILDDRQAPQTLDTPGESADVTYECSIDGQGETTTLDVSLAAPAEAETGQTVEVVGDSDRFYYAYNEEVAEGNATHDIQFDVSGDAAPTDSVNFALQNTEAFMPGDDEIAWTDPEVAALDLTNPGDLVFVPGTVTTTIDQPSGSSVTVCDPVDAEPIHVTSVTGDPIDEDPEDEDPEDEDPEDEDPEDEDPEDEDGDEQNPPEDEDGKGDGEDDDGDADGGLPVTGAALGGLVAAAVAALGGGSGAMYLARKRRNTASASEE